MPSLICACFASVYQSTPQCLIATTVSLQLQANRSTRATSVFTQIKQCNSHNLHAQLICHNATERNLFQKFCYFHMSIVPTSPEVIVLIHNSTSGLCKDFFQTLLKCLLYTRIFQVQVQILIKQFRGLLILPLCHYTRTVQAFVMKPPLKCITSNMPATNLQSLGMRMILPTLAYSPNII